MAPAAPQPDEHDIDDLIRQGQSAGQACAETLRHFGADAPRVQGYVDLGVWLPSGAAATPSGLEQLTRHRALVTRREGSGWMDNTTLATAVTLLSDDGGDAMTPMTVWDLATFVQAIISCERIYHHEHPQVDDRAIGARLGEDVLQAVPLPVQGPSERSPLPDPWEGPHRLMYELWEDAMSRLKRLAECRDGSTLDGRELLAVRDGWRRALDRTDVELEDLTNVQDARTRWTSPTDELLYEIAAVSSTYAVYPDLDPDGAMRRYVAGRAELGFPERNPLSVMLTDLNLRAYVNQNLADFFQLPYVCGIARLPFRRHLYDRAVAVQQRLTTLDVIDDRYAELAAGVQLRLPVFLASALAGAQRPDDLWDAIGRLRRDAAPYREARTTLDAALADGDLKELRRVRKALVTSVDGVLPIVGGATTEAGVAAVEQVAQGDSVGIVAAVAGAVAAGRALLGSSIGTRLAWRLRRPHLLWINNVVDEAQHLTEALPALERIWRIPERELPIFATRFDATAALGRRS